MSCIKCRNPPSSSFGSGLARAAECSASWIVSSILSRLDRDKIGLEKARCRLHHREHPPGTPGCERDAGPAREFPEVLQVGGERVPAETKCPALVRRLTGFHPGAALRDPESDRYFGGRREDLDQGERPVGV